ncbi:hypothetical protein KDA14_06050, partial [Candidatus Saccharibacteria bacterium]|nr:hypothetical protein [Candidatus Saccharibacteria bacterium]
MSLLLIILPLVVGNTWHAIMLWMSSRRGMFANSISENALISKPVLEVHRAMHIILAVCFTVYSYGLWERGYPSLAVLLTSAVVLDVTQVLTLSKHTKHTPFYFRDRHQLAAWLMAVLYLLYTIAAAITAHVGAVWIVIYLGYILLMQVGSSLTEHRYFWLAQMVFFVSVSAAIIGFTA